MHDLSLLYGYGISARLVNLAGGLGGKGGEVDFNDGLFVVLGGECVLHVIYPFAKPFKIFPIVSASDLTIILNFAEGLQAQ